MGKSIAQLYKFARKHLKLNQKEIAEELNSSDAIISQIETGRTQSPNYEYTKFLIEQGINPYFLIGASDEVTGQKLEDFVPKAEHEKLKAEFEDLLHEHKTLQNVLKILQIEVDEDGNVKKKT